MQTEAYMKKLMALLLLIAMPAAANVSGIWNGAFRAVGSDSDTPQLFTLKQIDDKLAGSGGPDSTEQYPIINGTVAGAIVKFEIKTAQRDFIYDLKATEKELRGNLIIKGPDDTRNAKVWLERAH